MNVVRIRGTCTSASEDNLAPGAVTALAGDVVVIEPGAAPPDDRAIRDFSLARPLVRVVVVQARQQPELHAEWRGWRLDCAAEGLEETLGRVARSPQFLPGFGAHHCGVRLGDLTPAAAASVARIFRHGQTETLAAVAGSMGVRPPVLARSIRVQTGLRRHDLVDRVLAALLVLHAALGHGSLEVAARAAGLPLRRAKRVLHRTGMEWSTCKRLAATDPRALFAELRRLRLPPARLHPALRLSAGDAASAGTPSPVARRAPGPNRIGHHRLSPMSAEADEDGPCSRSGLG